jgi:uncharacterized lipoprotein YmbA
VAAGLKSPASGKTRLGRSERVGDEAVRDLRGSGWEEISSTLIAYLAACGITERAEVAYWIREIERRVVIRLPLYADESLPAVAIEETQRLIDHWAIQALGLNYPVASEQVFAARAALLAGTISGKWSLSRQALSGNLSQALPAAIVVPVPPKSELTIEIQPLEIGYWKLRTLLKYEVHRVIRYFRRP